MADLINSDAKIDLYHGFLKQESLPKFIKIYKNLDEAALQNCLDEINIMKSNPEYFTQIFGIYCSEITPSSTNVSLGIVCEEMTLSLEKLMLEETNEERKKHLAINFLEKIIKLHSKGISHNNLKPENVFTDDTFARICFTNVKIYQKFSDIKWSAKIALAPENFQMDVVAPSIENDIWSVGYILFKLMLKNCSLNVPWIFNLQSHIEVQRQLIIERQKQEEKNMKEKYIVQEGVCSTSNNLIQKIEDCFFVSKMKRVKLQEVYINFLQDKNI